jgi:thioredoxin reductase (NADPH)
VDAELVIVGAGPAGVSAALWAKSRDLEPLLIERSPKIGGRLHDIHFHPRELLGVTDGDGPAIASSLERQLGAERIAVRTGVTAQSLRTEANHVTVALNGSHDLSAGAVLLAVGTRRRTLDVPGERELEDRGVYYSATRDRDRLTGKRVAVVGGGDAAYENALILARSGCRVVLLVRGAPTARREFRDRVSGETAIEIQEDTTVTAIEGDGGVSRVRATHDRVPMGASRAPAPHDAESGRDRRIEVEAVVIKVGDVPNTEWCRGSVALDRDGYVVVDAQYRTSMHRVWAVGDVIRPPIPGVAAAAGSAALAVADIRVALRG